MDHIQPLRLFDLVQSEAKKSTFRLEDSEQQHLQGCIECQQVREVFARQFAPKKPANGGPAPSA
jgi:hypothetical protein